MSKARLEAFSDGVIAILITIMVMEFKVPAEPTPAALLPQAPLLLSYLMSFVFLGIYWNNHHHLLQAAQRIGGWVLWANLHLLFWLSLIPFVTEWMGRSNFSTWPVAIYGVNLLLAAMAFTILVKALVGVHSSDSLLVAAIGNDIKGKISLLLYLTAIPSAFVSRWLACGLYVAVAMIWLVPDRRIEKRFDHRTPT